MPDEVSEAIGEYLDYFFSGQDCFVYTATLEEGNVFKQQMSPWPAARKSLVRFALAENAKGKDVYFCPSPFSIPENGQRPRPLRENVLGSRVLYVDFDKQSAPQDWEEASEKYGVPEPTLRVQSSVKGNEHDYWLLPELKDPDWIEEKNRALAARMGADLSGWDANQLLRIPHLSNFGFGKSGARKDWYKGSPVPVEIISRADKPVDFEHFETLRAEKEALGKLQVSESLPTAQEALALGKTTEEILAQFNMTKEEASASSPEKRSGALMRLSHMLAEAGGFSDDQMYAILEDADRRWEKYINRSTSGRKKILLDTIARARAKHGYLSDEDVEFSGLLKGSSAISSGDIKLVYTLEEFLNAEIHIDWILSKQVAMKSIGIVTGQPGVGKTQLALNYGIRLALGEDFLDSKNVAGPVKVLFLSLEMAHPSLDTFIRPIVSEENVRLLSKNFLLAPIGSFLSLNTAAGRTLMDNILSDFKPDVVIIDSLQRMTTESLSDETKTRELMENLDRIREKHSCAMILVHHDRKTQPKQDVGGLSDMYGSTFIGANVDWVVSLTRHPEIPGALRLADWKNRLAPERMAPLEITRSKTLQFSLAAGPVMSDDGDEGEPFQNGVLKL